jgi:hypothetical protein
MQLDSGNALGRQPWLRPVWLLRVIPAKLDAFEEDSTGVISLQPEVRIRNEIDGGTEAGS